jgi:hypothetical protein
MKTVLTKHTEVALAAVRCPIAGANYNPNNIHSQYTLSNHFFNAHGSSLVRE